MDIDIQLLEEPLSLEACRAFVTNANSGGLAFFVGTVRNQTKGKVVLRLDFEAYKPMALLEMKKIALSACKQWPIERIVIHHRIGTLNIGEAAVIIGVATPHRVAAFEACQFSIDTLKETVPIWKKEIFSDGEVWVAAHP